VTPEELRDIPLLADASDASIAKLASSAGELTCGPGQILALQGDAGSGMFLIVDGTVAVEWRGGSTTLEAGTFVGELTLLAPGGSRNARVRAVTELRCLAIGRDDALELIENEPSVALAMLREMARRFASAIPDE
jgi:CRP-like cAMP-binding protein